MERWTGLIAIAWILALSWFLSEKKKEIKWRIVAVGLLLQFGLALTVIKGQWVASFFEWLPLGGAAFFTIVLIEGAVLVALVKVRFLNPIAKALPMRPVIWLFAIQAALWALKENAIGRFFESLKEGVGQLLQYASQGSSFVFGPLGSSSALGDLFGPVLGDKIPMFTTLFAFQILPTIIFVASLFSVLYYLGIMQPIVRGFAVVMNRAMGASGAESLDVAANIFMGQTEAPLTIFPYLSRLTRSELFTVMVSGMAHTAAGILLAYAAVSHADAKHLLTAIILTAPGSIMLAKMWIPETEMPETSGKLTAGGDKSASTNPNAGSSAPSKEDPNAPVNVIDAAARGASSGLSLALNVAAMLVAFIALIALLNGIISGVRGLIIGSVEGIGILAQIAAYLPESLQQLLGWVFAPIAWTLGVPWQDSASVGNLLGTRLVVNEFVAYVQLGPLKEVLTEKSFVISTYALCGFANLSSIAIQVGGIGALIPERRKDLAALGFRAVIVGTMANLMSAAIAGILL